MNFGRFAIIVSVGLSLVMILAGLPGIARGPSRALTGARPQGTANSDGPILRDAASQLLGSVAEPTGESREVGETERGHGRPSQPAKGTGPAGPA